MALANTAPFDVEREIAAKNFEDIRKWIFVILNPWAGNVTESSLYTVANWEGSWAAYALPDRAEPGDLVVRYQDSGGHIDYYVNYIGMTESVIDQHPPIGPDGMLDYNWRLAPDPNKYHTLDHNAGNPSIGADGRWRVIHNPANEGCGHLEYTRRDRAYKWLPRQLDPYRQIPPLGETARHQAVELQKVFVGRNLAPTHERSLDSVGYEDCKHPRRLTEYILDWAEPSWVGDPSDECSASNQCAMGAKLNEAYLDQVIRTCEEAGSRFLKQVDATWLANWLSAQTKVLWALTTYYTVGQIVYKVTETDTVLYVCYAVHTSDANSEPGVGADWEDYWATPAYSPDYVPSQPVYVEFNGNMNVAPSTSYSWFWECNDSAYELCLKSLGGIESVYPAWSADHGDYFVDDVVQHGDICRRCKTAHESDAARSPTNGEYWEEVTQFDWWWDTSHPAVPIWLYKLQYGVDAADWPLPRGCWRRTWKHGPGRLGSIMWPGEKGDPPGYEGLKLIVAQSDYNAMPAANRRWYAVSNVESLHAAAYGEAEEALIARRHDPAHIRWVEWYDEDIGEMVWTANRVYELHHDLVNDMRNVLIQLHLVDDTGLTIAVWRQIWGSGTPINEDASWESYMHCIGRSEAGPPAEAEIAGTGWLSCGYTAQIYWDGGYWQGAASKTIFLISIEHGAGPDQSMTISRPLIRVGWRGTSHHSAPWQFDGCEIGFEDLTAFAAPRANGEDGPIRYAYISLDVGAVIYPGWWDFAATVVSPWPDTARGGFFDWTDNPTGVDLAWDRYTEIQCRAATIDQWCVLNYDYNLVPETVWDEIENISQES